MACESTYVLTANQVRFLEGLLALDEEWGGYINMRPLTKSSPFVYEVTSIDVRKGTFHGADVPCDESKISFHTHPTYVTRQKVGGDQKGVQDIRFANALPSGPDMQYVTKCASKGMPSLVFTPLGTFVVEVTDEFMMQRQKQAARYRRIVSPERKMEEADKFFRTLFDNLQRANMEDDPDDPRVPLQRFSDNLATVGVRVTHFEPGSEVIIRVSRNYDTTSQECEGMALMDPARAVTGKDKWWNKLDVVAG